MDPRWKHPFTCIVSGPTGCGKSVFVFKMLDNLKEMVVPLPQKVIYCYGEYQSGFAKYPWVEFHEGLPKSEMFDGTPTMVVIDDLMNETNDMVANLFTKISHHRSVSVIYITQNVFHKTNRVAQSVLTRITWCYSNHRETRVKFRFWGGNCIRNTTSFSSKHSKMLRRNHTAICCWT